MLPVPSLKGIRATIPIDEILFKAGVIQDAIIKRARFYLEMGGDPSLRWSPDTPLLTILDDLSAKNADLLKSALKANNSEEKEFGVYKYDDDSEAMLQGGGTVYVSIENYVILYVSFLKRLSKKNPEKFKLVKNIIECIYLCPLTPMSCLTRFYENWYENIVFDSEEVEEDYKKGIMNEALEFDKLFDPGRCSDKQFKKKVNSLEREFKRLSESMNQNEKSWVKQALALFSQGLKMSSLHHSGQLHFLETDSDDGAPPDDAFCILMSEESNITCDWEQAISDEAMNVGTPIIKFLVASKANLAAAQEYALFLSMLQSVMYDCWKLQKEGKIWKK